MEVSKTKKEAKGMVGRGNSGQRHEGESKGQFYPTKGQNLKWGLMRLWKVDSELERCVRELALYPVCSGELLKIYKHKRED